MFTHENLVSYEIQKKKLRTKIQKEKFFGVFLGKKNFSIFFQGNNFLSLFSSFPSIKVKKKRGASRSNEDQGHHPKIFCICDMGLSKFFQSH